MLLLARARNAASASILGAARESTAPEDDGFTLGISALRSSATPKSVFRKRSRQQHKVEGAARATSRTAQRVIQTIDFLLPYAAAGAVIKYELFGSRECSRVSARMTVDRELGGV